MGFVDGLFCCCRCQFMGNLLVTEFDLVALGTSSEAKNSFLKKHVYSDLSRCAKVMNR